MNDRIASLVGSRICHDLISPIGAIGNGVELISMTQGASNTGAEMSLISESVDHASARIRFFRMAYGAAAADQFIGRAEILSILTDIARGGRMTYYWQIDSDQPRLEVRVAFLLFQCFETALPMGGDITVGMQNGCWTIIAKGERLQWDDALWGGLMNPFAKVEHTPAQVQFALLPGALDEARRSMTTERTDKQITATIR